MLCNRAVEEKHEFPRNIALEALIQYWPDDETWQLFTTRISIDGFVATWHAEKHSNFGRIIFTRDLNGISPHLSPSIPIPQQYLEKAAKQTNIPPDQLDATIKSLSEHMGWDITKGSQAHLNQDLANTANEE